MYRSFPLLILIFSKLASSDLNDSCQNPVFCQGELLHTVQMARLYRDSKTFVDMPLVGTAESTLDNFNLLMMKTQRHPTKEDIAEFVDQNFRQSTAHELEQWWPTDYKPNPSFLMKIQVPEIRKFAKFLHDIWPVLGRKVRAEVFQNVDKYSIIPVPHGFIIPGGRFREYYYWDSYWIIKGLLISGMKTTVRGMLSNFFRIVDTYGFIPNGGRIYYLDRSQPPILTMAAWEYFKYTKDSSYLKKNMPMLEKELNFWLEYKVVSLHRHGRKYELARYYSTLDTPRPESYYEDYETAQYYQSDEAKKHFYRKVRTAAETGWDFSGRWNIDQIRNPDKLMATIDPVRVIPVDLNAFLAKNFRIMADLYDHFWQYKKAKFWRQKAEEWEEAIHDILYNEDDGIWYDYDLMTNTQRKFFFMSNFTPLWTESYNKSMRDEFGKNATDYLKANDILRFKGGMPATIMNTGQQWDEPNAWAPLHSIVLLGLERSGNAEAKEMAEIFTVRFLECVGRAGMEMKVMFEKYNAAFEGMYGGGGEYDVQTGFGWTNGVVLELIDYYYIKLKKDLKIKIVK